MKVFSLVSNLALVSGAVSQSICNKYTQALFGSNTHENQHALLVRVVNTAIIGNYTQPNVGIAVPGLLSPTTYMGEKVNLLPYFNGQLLSSNRGGDCGVSVNFLDGGGATPLMQNKPSNSKNTEQFDLLTHLYQFFAALLGCSIYGNTFKAYEGFNGMYEVHKFMALDAAEVGWFIQNVGLSAASFGVSDADVQTVGTALSNLFGYRCSAPASVPSFETPQLQAICTDCDCPVSSAKDCQAYGPVIQPLTQQQAAAGQCCSEGQYCGYGGGGDCWSGHGWGSHGYGGWHH